YGHLAGDQALKHLALVIEAGVRDYDVFARFGGEEFAFLLRGASLKAAVRVAERVRSLIAASGFSFDEHQLSMTVSVGVASIRSRDKWDNVNSLVAEADRFLYEAKKSGRNC